VEIYLSDTVSDFVAKVVLACAELASLWEHRGEEGVESLAMGRRYRQVAAAAGDPQRLAVLAFAPPSDSQLGSWTDRDPGLAEPHDDPRNWYPLDPVCTFEHYALKFGFGASSGPFLPLLRVVKRSIRLGQQSHLCRRALQEQLASENRLDMVNSAEQCYGFAQYTHDNDNESTEWRPCVVRRRPPSPRTGPRTLSLSWAFMPLPCQETDPSSVLLACVQPKLMT